MARITIYIIMLSVMIILFHAAGLMEESSISVLIQWVINPESMRFNEIYMAILAAVILAVAVGATVGTIAPGRTDLAVLAAAAAPLLLLVIFDFVTIFGIVRDSIGTVFSLLLFSPIILGFAFDVVSWFGGRS